MRRKSFAILMRTSAAFLSAEEKSANASVLFVASMMFCDVRYFSPVISESRRATALM